MKGKAARFSSSAQSNGRFDCLLRTRCAIYRCQRRPGGAILAPQHPESEECRFESCFLGKSLGREDRRSSPEIRETQLQVWHR